MNTTFNTHQTKVAKAILRNLFDVKRVQKVDNEFIIVDTMYSPRTMLAFATGNGWKLFREEMTFDLHHADYPGAVLSLQFPESLTYEGTAVIYLESAK